jgi:hypothetical protein
MKPATTTKKPLLHKGWKCEGAWCECADEFYRTLSKRPFSHHKSLAEEPHDVAPAVDVDGLAADPTGRGRAEPQHGVGDVFGTASAADEVVRVGEFFRFIREVGLSSPMDRVEA